MTDPILLDLPASIDTARLLLRAPRAGDGPAVFAAISGSLPEVRRFPASLPWVADEPSVEAFEVWCRSARARRASDGTLRNTCIDARLASASP